MYNISEKEAPTERQETKQKSKNFNNINAGDWLENKGQILNVFEVDLC